MFQEWGTLVKGHLLYRLRICHCFENMRVIWDLNESCLDREVGMKASSGKVQEKSQERSEDSDRDNSYEKFYYKRKLRNGAVCA